MADETHKLQKDPPEGSRKTVEHELRRQSGNSAGKPGGQDGNNGSVRQDKAQSKTSG